MFALDDVEPADAGTDVNADALRNFRRDFQAAHLHRLVGRSQREVDEAAHLLYFFFLDEIQRVEIFDFGGDLAGGLEASNWVIRATPLLPASRFFHTSSVVLPTPQIRPMPVTTTRLANYFPPFACLPM